jgi:murein DD-endopeptidase MepM/ murein hydrolase activator NlpD
MWSTGRHEGVDFACPKGTPILACADGKVVGTGIWGGAYGKHSLVIKHKVGEQTLYTMYAHGQKLYVKKDDVVTKGQHVLDSGAEGNVTGPHLHLECQAKPTWTKGGGINPQPLIDL